MKEQKLRQIVREEISRVITEDYAGDPGTAASSGGPGTEWFQVARLFSDVARDYPEVKDIGQKQIGGETVHEIAINDRVYQIRLLR